MSNAIVVRLTQLKPTGNVIQLISYRKNQSHETTERATPRSFEVP